MRLCTEKCINFVMSIYRDLSCDRLYVTSQTTIVEAKESEIIAVFYIARMIPRNMRLFYRTSFINTCENSALSVARVSKGPKAVVVNPGLQ